MFKAALLSLAFACWLGGCATVSPSVATFGDATAGFADQMAETADGTYAVCVASRNVRIDLDLVTGVILTPDQASAAVKDDCESFARTGRLYARLSNQLGGFGRAMATLAEGDGEDYTEGVGALATSAGELVPQLRDKQPQLDAATALGSKVLHWFAEDYTSGKISDAVKDSRAEVVATLELSKLVLAVLLEQAIQYESNLAQVAMAPDYAAKAQLARQARLLEEHLPKLHRRKLLLTATATSLEQVRIAHQELVAEAEKSNGRFDGATLGAKSTTLRASVLEHQALIGQLRRNH